MTKHKIIAIFTFIVAAIFLLLYWNKSDLKFPVFASGSYIGTFQFENGDNIPVFIDKAENQPLLYLAVVNNDWQPQSTTNLADKIAAVQATDAIVIKAPFGKIKLSGNKENSGAYSGSIADEHDKKIGTWYVSQIQDLPAVRSEKEMDSLRAYLVLDAQLQDVEKSIDAEEIIVTQQKSELERLNAYVTEGESLRSNADKKLEEKKAELKNFQDQKIAKLREAGDLADKFELSQKLVGMGKLVALARESLERENRWADTMLASTQSDMSGDLDAAVARGERIKALKKEIETQKQRTMADLPSSQ